MTGSNVAGDTRQASEVTPLEDYIMTAVIDQRSTPCPILTFKAALASTIRALFIGFCGLPSPSASFTIASRKETNF